MELHGTREFSDQYLKVTVCPIFTYIFAYTRVGLYGDGLIVKLTAT